MIGQVDDLLAGGGGRLGEPDPDRIFLFLAEAQVEDNAEGHQQGRDHRAQSCQEPQRTEIHSLSGSFGHQAAPIAPRAESEFGGTSVL